VAGGKESFITEQEYFQLAMLKKLDDCKECVQDHINAKDSGGKMLLYVPVFRTWNSSKNETNVFILQCL